MAISSTVRKAGPFIGNGTSTEFSFDFKVFEPDDVAVIRACPLGVEARLVVGDYVIALNEDQNEVPGGVVTLAAPLATGCTLVLLSDVPMLQPVDVTNQGGFYPELLNDGLDRSTIQVQQVLERLGRAITLPATAEGFDLALPLPAPGQLIGWSDGRLANYAAADLGGVIAYGAARVDKFDGDGTQTSFTLSASPGSQNNLRISIDGVVQVPGDDFTWTGGTTLSFVSAPPAGTRIVVQYQEALADITGAVEAGAAAGASSGDAAGTAAGTAAAEAVVAGKANTELQTNATLTQFGAGASAVTVGDDFSHLVRASQYVQTSDGSDMGLSANRAIAAIRARGYGELFFDNGIHGFSTQLNNDNTGETGTNPLSHISMIGPGSASCELRWIGPNGVPCINVQGGAWGGGSDTRIRMQGFTLRGLDARPVTNRLGILAARTGFLKMEDVHIKEFYQAFHATDIVGAKLEDVNIGFNSQGIIGDGGMNPTAGSAPNEWTISRCHFGNNREFWAKLTGVTNLLVLNGSNEGTGHSVGGLGTNPSAVGLWLVNPCFNGATALKMISPHHEYNVGRADILIEHDQNPAVYSIDSIDLFRVDANNAVAAHIEINTTGATPYQLNLSNIGVGFNIYGSPVYVPTVDDIVKRTGTPNARDEVNAFGVNVQSGMIRPAFTNEAYAAVGGSVMVGANGQPYTSATHTLQSRRVGDTLFGRASGTITTNGAAGGAIQIGAAQLPAPWVQGVVGYGAVTSGPLAGTPLMVEVLAGSPNLYIKRTDGAYPVGSGDTFKVQFNYPL